MKEFFGIKLIKKTFKNNNLLIFIFNNQLNNYFLFIKILIKQKPLFRKLSYFGKQREIELENQSYFKIKLIFLFIK